MANPQQEIDALLPDNTSGQIDPLRTRTSFTLVTDEQAQKLDINGDNEMAPGFIPTNPQHPVTLQFMSDHARGKIAETASTALNAVGQLADVVVNFDGDATRQFRMWAKVHFDTTTNIDGSIDYQMVFRDNLNAVTQQINGSRPAWDLRVSSNDLGFEITEPFKSPDVGGTLTFSFQLNGEWNTITNTKCDVYIYDDGAA